MNRRILAMALIAVSVSALLVPTGGFGSTSMDRAVAISVAEHEDAVVAIWDPGGPTPEPPRNPGEKPVRAADDDVVVLVLQNRFADRTLDVRVTDRGDSAVDVRGGVADVRPGDVVDVTGTVDCDGVRGRVAVPLELAVVSTDGEVTGTVDYTASVVCAGQPSSHDADANASGNATTTQDSRNATTTNATRSSAS